jgi:antirestriction protein
MKFLFAATLLLLSVFGKRDEEKLLSQPEKIELSQPEQIEQIIKQTILTPMEMMLVQFESMPKMDDMEIQETAITRHAQMVEANKEHLQLLENQKEIMVKPLENLENLEIVESVKAMFDHMIKMSSKIPTVEEIVKSIKEEQENTMKMMNDFSKIMTDMEKSLPIVMKQMEDDYESMAKDLFEGFNDEDMADSMKYLFGDDDSLFDELKVEDNLKIQAEKLVGAKNRLEKEINDDKLSKLFEGQEELELNNNNDYDLLD